jgi:hypothetical protein
MISGKPAFVNNVYSSEADDEIVRKIGEELEDELEEEKEIIREIASLPNSAQSGEEEESEDEYYEVEKILDCKNVNGIQMFHVKWQNFGNS